MMLTCNMPITWAMKPQKIQGPSTTVRFWVSSVQVRLVVLKAVIDKVQACPTPKNVKELQALVGILGSGRTFIPHLHSASVSYAAW